MGRQWVMGRRAAMLAGWLFAWASSAALAGQSGSPAEASAVNAGQAVYQRADLRRAEASAEVLALVNWSLSRVDARGRPFAVVDKRAARLYVFSSQGRLVGWTAALLGLARGDESVPGVGQKVAAGIPRDERTTPAGRFESLPGHTLTGEANVWIDYEAAVSIHRMRPTAPSERRPQRLASDTPDDNRISLGCVVVDGTFYDRVVAPTLGRQRGVVYVLPETRNWREQFGTGLEL